MMMRAMQQQLLKADGIKVTDGRVDLKVYGIADTAVEE